MALLASACAGRGGGDVGGGGATSGGSGAGGSGNGAGGAGQVQAGQSGTGATVVQPASVGLALFNDSSLCQAGMISVGSTPLRRLSRIEYNNMVRDLGLDPSNTQPANQFESEQKIDGNFNTNAYAAISGTIFNQQYLEAAETLAASAVASNLGALVTCTTQDAACATQFISSFAGRAFRGQLDAGESAALLTLYNNVRAGGFDFPTGIQAIITSVLTSPRFLFVLEFGQTGASGTAGATPLAPLELATRLSLYLWRSLPDPTLTTAATSGHLASASDVATQATRMLADPKATDALHDFADQWLDIENMDTVTKDSQFKTWSANLAQELHMETLLTFSSTVLAASKNGLGDLLTSASSYVNTDLATFYNNPTGYAQNNGSPGVATDYKSTPVGTASAPRMGILTDASVLASHAHTSLPSPTKRGRLLRQQILCEQIPNPPASVGGAPIPPPPVAIPAGQTTRALYTQHVAANSACNACHEYMDWLGFGFDDFDATGAFITTEGGTTATNGTAVDSSGKFIQMAGASDIGGTFTGTADMIRQLSASPQVDQCYALEQLRYALGRVESSADACSAQQIYQTFSTGNSFNLQQLLVAVVSSDSFRYRTAVNAGEACQ
jgi:uncharacterized protein DUF1592/uncharacterized protein DUF1588/uncharacterized protein DUF1595/uncharacterized protein DUF1585/uncharacterized protein DUF1587